ncbi:MAG: hypothetical protein FJX04_02030 [Alphaproteobacteria bacterium]|nr:hypothetical protein [Alphaproteobacteria bacterium]
MVASDWFLFVVLIVLFGAGPVLAALIFFELRHRKAQLALEARLEKLSDQMGGLDSNTVRSSITLESSFTDAIRKVQAEIKSLEIVFRGAGQSPRENPESVDAAIRLAREGVSSDLIVAKTGLPVHAVESIISLHGRR